MLEVKVLMLLLELGEKTLKSWTGHPKVKIVSPKEKNGGQGC